jgi:hypothetical protein
MRLTVGAGVIKDKLFIVGVGMSNVNPYSLENVISWSHSVIDTLEAKPVRTVAHTVVSVDA